MLKSPSFQFTSNILISKLMTSQIQKLFLKITKYGESSEEERKQEMEEATTTSLTTIDGGCSMVAWGSTERGGEVERSWKNLESWGGGSMSSSFFLCVCVMLLLLLFFFIIIILRKKEADAYGIKDK